MFSTIPPPLFCFYLFWSLVMTFTRSFNFVPDSLEKKHFYCNNNNYCCYYNYYTNGHWAWTSGSLYYYCIVPWCNIIPIFIPKIHKRHMLFYFDVTESETCAREDALLIFQTQLFPFKKKKCLSFNFTLKSHMSSYYP